MVQLTLPPNLTSAIQLYNTLTSTTPSDRIDLETTPSIDHHTIHKVSSALLANNDARTTGASRYRLSSLLKGCSVYVAPKPPKPEPTPEFTALMTRLRLEAEARDYAALTNKMHPTGTTDDDDEYTIQDLKSHLSIIANVLLSTFATSAAVWMVASSWDVPERLALAFTCSLVVCVAEVVIFGGYLRRIDESRAEEKKRGEREVKVVVNTWEIGTEGEKVVVNDWKAGTQEGEVVSTGKEKKTGGARKRKG